MRIILLFFFNKAGGRRYCFQKLKVVILCSPLFSVAFFLFHFFNLIFPLTLPVSIPDEEKNSLNFYFNTSMFCLIKPFETPQRILKIKIEINFFVTQFSEMQGAKRVNKLIHLGCISFIKKNYLIREKVWENIVKDSIAH